MKGTSNAVFRQECKLNKCNHKQYQGTFKSYYMSNGQMRGKGRFKYGVDTGKALYYLDGTVMLDFFVLIMSVSWKKRMIKMVR